MCLMKWTFEKLQYHVGGFRIHIEWKGDCHRKDLTSKYGIMEIESTNLIIIIDV